MGDSIAVSPAACMRRGEPVRSLLQQQARVSDVARTEGGATRDRGAEQPGRSGQLVCLPADSVGHLERVRDPACQQQGADMCVGDVESHLRGVESACRDVVSSLRDVNGVCGAARIPRDLRKRPSHLRADDGNILQHKAFRSLHRGLRLVHCEPVHGQKGIDVRAGILRCAGRRLVDDLLRPRRITKRPKHIARPEEGEPGPLAIGQLARANTGEHGLRLLPVPEPGQRVRPDEARLGSSACLHRRFCEPVRQREVGQPYRAVRRAGEQVGVGCEVGVETQRRAAHDDSNVVTVIGRREFGRRPGRAVVGAWSVRRAFGAPPRTADAQRGRRCHRLPVRP